METLQTTALRSAGIPRRVLDTCCHSDSSEKPSANAVVKNSQKSNNSNYNDLSAQLYDIKYFYIILIIYLPLYGLN